jgi:serine/threonine-protein kinase
MAETESTAAALGKYRPIAELGHGGMAEVFLALASGPAGFNKLVVIKQIRAQFAEEQDFLTMFLDEARLAARLNHPNVVQTNEVGDDGKRYYICMEYLEGQPLNRIMTRIGVAGGLTQAIQLRILVDALAGLHHAHELHDFDGTPLQVVHRDVTPHNIFVTYAGQVKVVDFGIAKALSSSSETRTGVLKGKVAYMAPEQAMGERVDRRADIFSTGMIIWEILAGKRLFKGVADVAVLQKIVNNQIPSPRTVQPDVPERLEAICMKALAHDRNVRYATAADLAADLEAALDDLGMRGSLREAGKIISKFFEADQLKIKALVEAQTTSNRLSHEPHDPASFDPRVTGSGPKARLPIIDAPGTESVSNAREIGPNSVSGSGSGSIRIVGERSSSEPSHPSSLTGISDTPAAPGKRTRMGVAVGALVVGAAVAVALFASRGGGSGPAAATASATAPSPAATHMLRIESSPAGATVSEGGQLLGKTPISLPLQPNQTAARQLVILLEGYAPYVVEQPPATEDVRVVVPLVASASPQAATAKASAAPSAEPRTAPAVVQRAPVVAPPPPVVKGPAPGNNDINMAR